MSLIKMSRIVLFFLLISQVSPFFISSISDLSNVVQFGIEVNMKTTMIYNKTIAENKIIRLQKFAEAIKELSEKVIELENDFYYNTRTIINALKAELFCTKNLSDKLNAVEDYVNEIEDIYDQFIYIINENMSIQENKILSFVVTLNFHNLIGHGTEKSKLSKLVFPGRDNFDDNLFINLSKIISEISVKHCLPKLFPQRWLFQLYSLTTIIEMKKYLIYIYAQAVNGIYENKSFTINTREAENQFTATAEMSLVALKRALSSASRDYHRCDPFKHEFNETYLEFSGLFQSIIINQAPISQDSEPCIGACKSSIKSNDFCRDCRKYSVGICNGHLVDCKRMKSLRAICQSPEGSSKRYDWFEADEKFYGDNSQCSGSIIYPLHHSDYFSEGSNYCENCVCTCIAELGVTQTLRTFSLMKQVTDHQNNMIVTGVRFMEKDNIVHIQIKQGQLLPYGRVSTASEHWKPLGNFQYINEGLGEFYSLNENGERKKLRLGYDFAFIYDSQKTLHLDDVIVPVNHVVTGVRISQSVDKEINKINYGFYLEVCATKFNFESGKLSSDDPDLWINAEFMNSQSQKHNPLRTEVILKNPGHPLSSESNFPDFGINQFINFRASDLEKDAGQSTVPFLDIQTVNLSPGFPLAGIGIFHKGTEGSGGFIALKIITLDISKYIKLMSYSTHLSSSGLKPYQL